MTDQKIQALRDAVEKKYLSLLADLKNKKLEIEAWRTKKIAWLDIFSATKSPEEWLRDSPIVVATSFEKPDETSSETAPVVKVRQPVEPKINQARVVRDAVEKISGEISNEAVRAWLKANRPDIADKIKPQSIRASLVRLEQAGKLEQIRLDGQMKIFKKVDRPQKGALELGLK
ncbi:MAG: hypothetical protein JW718_10310 [Desulfovibrionaceae bacterium]|nr:hypothetical protein [Desulfovibrionaceae bacterium]